MVTTDELIRSALEDKKPTTLEEAIDIIQAVEKRVMVERHRKYGKGNISKRGLVGIQVRMEDKLERSGMALFGADGFIRTLNHDDETLADTFLDHSNYATIALLYMNDLWQLPLADSGLPTCSPSNVYLATSRFTVK